MRVVMPGRFLDRQVGGNTTYARNLASELRREGHAVDSLGAGPGAVGSLVRENLAALRSPRAHGATVLHYVADTGPLWPARLPAVLTVHGVASRWTPVARTAAQEASWRLRVRRAIEACDRVVTVSRSSARDVADVFDVDGDRLAVIPHGIAREYFEPVGPEADRRAVELVGVDPFVLYVGNIEPRKNLVALVRAMESPSVRSLGLRLVVAGRPAWNARESLAALAGSPSVDYVGFVPEDVKRALMRRCAAFVFPSLYEGFGLPVLEALAAGCVVVCTDEGSLAEVAGPAIRAAGTSSEAIADALLTGLTDEARRDTCRASGAAWASTFTWARSARRHLAVYEEVVAR